MSVLSSAGISLNDSPIHYSWLDEWKFQSIFHIIMNMKYGIISIWSFMNETQNYLENHVDIKLHTIFPLLSDMEAFFISFIFFWILNFIRIEYGTSMRRIDDLFGNFRLEQNYIRFGWKFKKYPISNKITMAWFYLKNFRTRAMTPKWMQCGIFNMFVYRTTGYRFQNCNHYYMCGRLLR